MFKRTTRTILATTALAAGLLGAVPLAHAGIGIPQTHRDGLGIPQKRVNIIAVFWLGASTLDFPPGPTRS